jgi:hypothetical protein
MPAILCAKLHWSCQLNDEGFGSGLLLLSSTRRTRRASASAYLTIIQRWPVPILRSRRDPAPTENATSTTAFYTECFPLLSCLSRGDVTASRVARPRALWWSGTLVHVALFVSVQPRCLLRRFTLMMEISRFSSVTPRVAFSVGGGSLRDRKIGTSDD